MCAFPLGFSNVSSLRPHSVNNFELIDNSRQAVCLCRSACLQFRPLTTTRQSKIITQNAFAYADSHTHTHWHTHARTHMFVNISPVLLVAVVVVVAELANCCSSFASFWFALARFDLVWRRQRCFLRISFSFLFHSFKLKTFWLRVIK